MYYICELLMKDQIKEILKKENLSSSQFADKIGVQRSSVSHVISGRNKPGFDFIMKILDAFPGINAEWLMRGSGEMYGKSHAPGIQEAVLPEFEQTGVEDRTNKSHKPESSRPTLPEPEEKAETSKEIERIVVFYSDKTFREYLTEP